MANVFISYARRDKERVLQLTNVLESEGLSVWWDSDLVPGRRYRQIIAEQLAIADSVIVVWTAAALESDWVQDEAEEGRQRGVLIPVILEPVRAPAGFRQVQAADLSQWTGSPEHPEFRSLLFAVRSLVQIARASGKDAAPPPPGSALEDAEAPDVAQVAEADRAPPERKPADAPTVRVQEAVADSRTPSAAKAPDVPIPATFTTALSGMMFRWSWWWRTAAAMIACAFAGEFSESNKAVLPYLLCVFPILAGAAAMACRNEGVSGAARAIAAWIGATAAGVGVVVVLALQHDGPSAMVFGVLYLGLLAMSASFGLAAAAAYMIGSFHRRSV